MFSNNDNYFYFSHQLSQWYERNKRDLPWRETKDPYHIWLSEIILQQTRVAQGLPYYLKFISELPTIYDFAAAHQDRIMKLWQGLGYYSRARNMHVCAKTVVDQYNGKFPTSYAELQRLKGIGKYTAAAIASICFDEPVPTIDGNVYRFFSRFFGMHQDIAEGTTFGVFFKKGQELMPTSNRGNFNQAIMEYGATVCMPKLPLCDSCIFNSQCYGFQNKMVHTLPIKSKKVKIKVRYFNYFVFQHQETVLIKQRQDNIWQGLFEFHLDESDQLYVENDLLEQLNNLAGHNHEIRLSSDQIIHVLTHQRIYAKFHVIDILDQTVFEQIKITQKMISVPLNELVQYPVPRLIDIFLKKTLNLVS